MHRHCRVAYSQVACASVHQSPQQLNKETTDITAHCWQKTLPTIVLRQQIFSSSKTVLRQRPLERNVQKALSCLLEITWKISSSIPSVPEGPTNNGGNAVGRTSVQRSKETHCIGVSEAAHEVYFLEDCLHCGNTALLGTQAYQHYAPSRRHRIKGGLHAQQRTCSGRHSLHDHFVIYAALLLQYSICMA